MVSLIFFNGDLFLADKRVSRNYLWVMYYMDIVDNDCQRKILQERHAFTIFIRIKRFDKRRYPICILRGYIKCNADN